MSSSRQSLIDKIDARTARVRVMGLGYVGLPLALAAVEAGFRVVGIDISDSRIAQLEARQSYLVDVPDKALADAMSSELFSVTTSFAEVSTSEVILISVPTPLIAGVPDLSSVLTAADEVAQHLRHGALVSLESTTFPGTTEEIIRPRLEAGGLTAGVDFSLVFSPERIDPANRSFGLNEIPKIIGGLTPECTRIADAFYSTIVGKTVTLGRPREAEMAKIVENTYRQVNIALANEFAMVANELDIDIWQVIDAAATKPFGFQAFYPGVGIGGHCIAVDPVYLTWRIRELGRPPFRLVELAREIDDSMPTYVAGRIAQALETRGLELAGAKLLVLGVTYKPDVADIRESRALEVLAKLVQADADVRFNDPFQRTVEIGATTYECAELDDALGWADATIILTHHSTYDWRGIVDRSKLVFDARGVTTGIDDPDIVRL